MFQSSRESFRLLLHVYLLIHHFDALNIAGVNLPYLCQCLRATKHKTILPGINHGTLNFSHTEYINIYVGIQFSHSVVSDSLRPHQPGASLTITNSRSLPKLMSIESVLPSNHLILCCPLLLLPSIFPKIRVFSNESAFCIRWPRVLEFQLQHQSFQ